MAEAAISIVPLKQFAKRTLKQYPLTYDFLLGEPDAISVREFVLKAGVWLQLLEKDIEMKKSG